MVGSFYFVKKIYIDKLEAVDNIQGYIKELIRADI